MKILNFESRKVSELQNWENNPRTILGEDFERLKAQIQRLGVYKTLLVNQDNIVLGGNMRLHALKELGIAEVMCGIVETDNEAEMLEYALSDNDQAGITDDMKLAEVFHLHPIDTQLYKLQSNTLRPLESIINPPEMRDEEGTDKDGFDESLDSYLNGSIKQIVLYYGNDEYGAMIQMLEEVGAELGLESNTEVITHLVREVHARIATTEK